MKQFIRYTILCVGYILGSQSLLYAETPTDSIDTIPTDSIIAKKDTTVKKMNIFQKVLKYFDDSNAPRPDKKFDFGVFFNGSAKRTIMISGISPFGQSDYNVMQFIADDYWSESNPNPNAKYPRLGLTSSQTANNTVASTYWMRNGNFIRFKTLELGYKFKYGRVYLNGDNIAVFSQFKLWDPELSWNAYPLQRTFNIGVQLNF